MSSQPLLPGVARHQDEIATGFGVNAVKAERVGRSTPALELFVSDQWRAKAVEITPIPDEA
jgi:hypothetical protein